MARLLARLVVLLVRLDEPAAGVGRRSDCKLLVVAFLRTGGDSFAARLVSLVLVFVAVVVAVLAALLVLFLHLLAILALLFWLRGE